MDPEPQQSEQARWFADEVLVHEPSLRSYLRGRFPSLTDIDDLVQETYARLFRARKDRPVRSPKSFIFATARNAAFDLFRRQRVIAIEATAEIDRMAVAEDKPGVAETLSRDQELELLAEAVQTLPERCREVLILQKIHGLSYRDISASLGISESTVNSQIAKGVLRCRDFMRARRVERRRP